jgi:hypothetical protein
MKHTVTTQQLCERGKKGARHKHREHAGLRPSRRGPVRLAKSGVVAPVSAARLAYQCRLIRYDERGGKGLSDRDVRRSRARLSCAIWTRFALDRFGPLRFLAGSHDVDCLRRRHSQRVSA